MAKVSVGLPAVTDLTSRPQFHSLEGALMSFVDTRLSRHAAKIGTLAPLVARELANIVAIFQVKAVEMRKHRLWIHNSTFDELAHTEDQLALDPRVAPSRSLPSPGKSSRSDT